MNTAGMPAVAECPDHTVQQEKGQGENNQDGDGDQIGADSPRARPLAGQLYGQNGDRLNNRPGAKNNGHQDGGLKRVKHQLAYVQIADMTDDIFLERLPVGNGVG